jgi:hypothetical protein
MGLSDLMKEIKLDPQAFLGDESIEFKVLGQVLQLVEDKISEVKNQAVKWWAILLLLFLLVLKLWIKSGTADQNHPGITNGVRRR